MGKTNVCACKLCAKEILNDVDRWETCGNECARCRCSCDDKTAICLDCLESGE